ncbi:hypothetical protein IFM89_008145 [Coptis chinensis]|uniref:Protein argonaute N-terminal domain-containing protein n=1 Tax=Coptis chinensis TaxID=261450 RepID=A0A835IX15_9MAGN|nr:hypothetical protein IFM89_008145 [Coptis chinensis]
MSRRTSSQASSVTARRVKGRADEITPSVPEVITHHAEHKRTYALQAITITPEVAKKEVNRIVINELIALYVDDKNGGGGSTRQREFKVAIKFAARPNLKQLQHFLQGKLADAPQEALKALDVV